MSDLFSSAGVELPPVRKSGPDGTVYVERSKAARDQRRELQAKDSALLTMEQKRKGWLADVREAMRRLAVHRCTHHGAGYYAVTPDDARVWFEGQDPPSDMSRNFLAAVFRGSDWVCVGTYKSGTKGSHGNELKKYRRREHCLEEELAG